MTKPIGLVRRDKAARLIVHTWDFKLLNQTARPSCSTDLAGQLVVWMRLYAIKYRFKSGKSRVEILVELRATYGNGTVFTTMVYRWYEYHPFQCGRQNIKLEGGLMYPIMHVPNNDGKYRKKFDIDTFFLFFYVRLWFGRANNLFYLEENLIKISRVHWKHFLVFSGYSIRADYEYKCELAMTTSFI